MNEPGRHCPLAYRTDPTELGRAPAFGADTFQAINGAVLQHHAMLGNVEAELAAPSADAGCGCAYPEWVESATVERSNAIMARLQATAHEASAIRSALSGLPCHLAVEIAGRRVSVVHGDPESLAGWNLAVETMPCPGTATEQIDRWFRAADADVIACTHTCLPFLQDFQVTGTRRLVINNGAAGMPNFRGDQRGVLTRISRHPSPVLPVYGTRLGPLHCDALGLEWTCQAWEAWFTRVWPEGSPAAISYGDRLRNGPQHTVGDAQRLY